MDDVDRAAARLAEVAHHTPVLTSSTLNSATGGSIFCKAENFQRVGAFKFRGAYNALAAMPPEERGAGVAGMSSGNHSQAVALAAALHDVPAVLLMPEDAPPFKIAATRAYGAEVVFYDRYSQERTELADSLAAERNMALVPPFNHWDVIAGQGTVASELFAEIAGLDTLVVCVGGGGLIAGCATVAAAQTTPVRVIGVEPAAGDDVKQSLERGQIVTIATPKTIADGQQTTAPGDKTLAVIMAHVDEIVTVTDDEIVAAMRFAFERMKVVLEPSGASALAAVMAGAVDVADRRVGVTLSGGNIDAARFAELVGNPVDHEPTQ